MVVDLLNGFKTYFINSLQTVDDIRHGMKITLYSTYMYVYFHDGKIKVKPTLPRLL